MGRSIRSMVGRVSTRHIDLCSASAADSNKRFVCPATRSNGGPFPDQLRHPLVQRQPLRLGGRRRRLMDAWIKAQHELAGMPFERLDSFLCAHFQKHLERSLPFMLQTGDVLGIKIRATVQTDKLAAKHFDVRVVLDDRPLTVNHHHIFHGFTPLFSSYLRIDSTAPLSVSGEGCGRWNTRTSPNSFTPMREPSRSLTFAPKSISSASISRHLMLPETGRAKIKARVFELLRFMRVQYHKTVSPAMRQICGTVETNELSAIKRARSLERPRDRTERPIF